MLTSEIARRLEQKIGLGDFPLVARRFFARLQRLCEQKGDGPLMIIAAVAEEAQGPQIRNKNQYFGFSVKRRLQEQGYLVPTADGPNQTVEQAKALEVKKATIGAPVIPPAVELSSHEIERLKLANELLVRQLEEARKVGPLPAVNESDAERAARRQAYWERVKAMPSPNEPRKGGGS